ncbi:MAG: hypothetical protein ACI82A_002042 [Candidatus Azotimanducaceae bacterium]|jgi:hypothetical protein
MSGVLNQKVSRKKRQRSERNVSPDGHAVVESTRPALSEIQSQDRLRVGVQIIEYNTKSVINEAGLFCFPMQAGGIKICSPYVPARTQRNRRGEF